MKNYIYNLIYQVTMLLIPLVTAPYLARILGVDGIGIYSYYYSVAYYFGLFVMLGINNYGNRSIAKCLGDQDKINKVFCEIYSMQLILGLVVFLAYMCYSLMICKERLIALSYVPFIISYILDVNWLFFGQENFKIVLLRNVFIKLVTMVAIFSFVHQPSDVVIYIIIMSMGALCSQIIVWFVVFKKCKFVPVGLKDIIYHLKPNLVLFIPVVAVSIYRTMDKIMLGTMANMAQVGYYENAEKIISILLSFITALGTVMLPRMTALYESENKTQIEKMIRESIVFVSLASSIVGFGVASVANDLVIVYYGKDYLPSGVLLQILCVTVPFISYANVVRMQILVPQGKDKVYVWSCVIGAIVNLILNALLIPTLQAIGAAIGTVAAEFMVLVVQIVNAKKDMCIGQSLKSIVLFIINGMIMCVSVCLIGNCLERGWVSLLLKVLCGALVFVLMLLLQWKVFKDCYIDELVQKICKRVKKGCFSD